jgi:hypothetical protein
MEQRAVGSAESSKKPEWREKESIAAGREFGGQRNKWHLIQFPQQAQEKEGEEIA